MTVPVADQRRLIHILADDLQPRIDWAYALEQTIALLGGGYLTAGNGDPNGLVTKPEGYLFLDLTTPAVWQNQNGGTVWTQLGSGGGSGLPDPWTANQTSGEVTATVDDPALTPFTIEAFAGQTENLFVVKDESGNVIAFISPTGDLLAEGGNLGLGNPNFGNVFATFDKSDNLVSRRGGIALYAQTDDALQQVQVFGDAGMAPDGTQHVARFAGNSLSTQPGGWEFNHEDARSHIKVSASAGQTDPCVIVQDENEVDVHRFGQADAGFFGATPVVQAAYIDPTTITPEQIANILIDYGLMAAS